MADYAAPPGPNVLAIDFLREWHARAGVYSLGAIEPDGPGKEWLTTKSLVDVEAFVERNASREWNTYFQPAVCNPTLGAHRASKTDVAAAECVWAEIDPPPDVATPEALEAWQAARRAEYLDPKWWSVKGLPRPTLVAFSGSGFVVAWRLEKTVETWKVGDGMATHDAAAVEFIESRNRKLVEILGADPASTDVSRLLRLPGTVNYPSKSKLARGRTGPEPATILDFDPARTCAAGLIPAAVARSTSESDEHSFELPQFTGAPSDAELSKFVEALGAVWPARGRHLAHLALAGGLARLGWPAELIARVAAAVAERQETGNAKLEKRLKTARDSIARLAAGKPVSGWPGLSRHVGELAVIRACSALGFEPPPLDPDGAAKIFEEWLGIPANGNAPPASEISKSNELRATAFDVAKECDDYGGDLMTYLGDDDPGDDEDAWLINGVLAAGVPNLIAGHPKARKTFVAEHMALCIALGIEWLGAPVKRGRVLLLPREDSVRETRRRIWRLCRGLGHEPRDLVGWLEIDTLRPFYWDDSTTFEAMRRTIGRFAPDLVIVDSLARSHMGDESSARDMTIVCNRWSDLCQQTGAAVAMIHHFTKSGEGSLLQRVRGSGAIGATARHLIGVEKPENPDAPFKFSFDGNLAGQSRPFNIRMLDGVSAEGKDVIVFERVVPATTPARDLSAPDAETISEVVNAIADSKSRRLPRAKLRVLVSGGKDFADPKINYLVTAGYIAQVWRGEKSDGYALTPAGEEFFRSGTPPIPGMLAPSPH